VSFENKDAVLVELSNAIEKMRSDHEAMRTAEVQYGKASPNAKRARRIWEDAVKYTKNCEQILREGAKNVKYGGVDAESILFNDWMNARKIRDTSTGNTRRKYYDLADELQYKLQDFSPLGHRMVWGSEFASKRNQISPDFSRRGESRDKPGLTKAHCGRHWLIEDDLTGGHIGWARTKREAESYIKIHRTGNTGGILVIRHAP
jgi:hypothetical protein